MTWLPFSLFGDGEACRLPPVQSAVETADIRVAGHSENCHRNGAAVVDELLSHGNAGHDDTVFRFANDVVSDQSAEISLMFRMLETVPPLRQD